MSSNCSCVALTFDQRSSWKEIFEHFFPLHSFPATPHFPLLFPFRKKRFSFYPFALKKVKGDSALPKKAGFYPDLFWVIHEKTSGEPCFPRKSDPYSQNTLLGQNLGEVPFHPREKIGIDPNLACRKWLVEIHSGIRFQVPTTGSPWQLRQFCPKSVQMAFWPIFSRKKFGAENLAKPPERCLRGRGPWT